MKKDWGEIINQNRDMNNLHKHEGASKTELLEKKQALQERLSELERDVPHDGWTREDAELRERIEAQIKEVEAQLGK